VWIPVKGHGRQEWRSAEEQVTGNCQKGGTRGIKENRGIATKGEKRKDLEYQAAGSSITLTSREKKEYGGGEHQIEKKDGELQKGGVRCLELQEHQKRKKESNRDHWEKGNRHRNLGKKRARKTRS